MNKWIIFIIVVIVVSVIGVGANLFTNYASSYKVDPTNSETVTQQESDPVIRFANISEYSISPGVLVVHNRDFSMNFLGTRPPKAYESLAEIGDPYATIALLTETSGVSNVFEIAAIEPGTTQEITIPLSSIRDKEGYANTGNTLISYMAKIAETNNGVVWLNGYPPYDAKNNQTQQERILAEIIDIDTNTNKPVQHHPEFYKDDAVSDEIVQITVQL